MATEIAILPLLEGVDLDNSTSIGSQTFQGVIDSVKRQKGFQRLYWGQEKANSTNLRVFIDWDAVDDHVAFTKTEYVGFVERIPALILRRHYQPFRSELGKVVDLSRAHVCHVNTTPHPPLALSAHVSPVTEILTVYFPLEYPDSDRKKFEENMKEVFAVVGRQEIYRGSAGGWVLEDVPIPNTDNTGKAFEAFIGWESVEAFKSFQQTSDFAGILRLLKGAKDQKGITIVFFTGQQVDKDT